MSSTSIRLLLMRAAPCGLALASIMLGLATCDIARAQSVANGAAPAGSPLRGSVDDDTDQPVTALPGSADAATGDADANTVPPQKFPPPKSTAKTRDRVKIPRKGATPLPVLQPYPTSTRTRPAGASIDTTDNQISPGPTVAALPVPTRLRGRIDDAPYDPVGIEVGSLRLTPYVAQSFGYDSNPDQVQTGIKPSAYSRTEGGLGVVSQWSSNELRADLRGGYNDYFSDPGASRPDATGTIDYRYDMTRDTIIDAEQRFNIDTQRPGSPELNVAAVGRPLITSFGETLGGTQNFGRLALGLHGTFDRTAYDNAQLSGGGIEDLANDNFSDYGLHLRGAYEISPVFTPFVDMLLDRRIHDAKIDLSGFARDSDGVIGQVGAIFEFDHLFSGTLSAGYGNRSFEDGRLQDINGPVVNAALSYAITPLTTLNLRAATSFDETTVAGASGSQSRSATFEVVHQLWRNLSLTGSVSYLNTQYVGAPITENTLSETLKAEYHLSRSLVAVATYNHEKLDSNSPGSSFDQNVFLVGLRLQR